MTAESNLPRISGVGRFAPSPTSALHLGNLRTAVVAYLMAKTSGRDFVMRVEDLDTQRVTAAGGRGPGSVAQQQLDDLAAIGLEWSSCMWQSDRLDVYEAVVAQLKAEGLIYECYCTRREILEAASAPHGDGYRPYAGTCSKLTDAELATKRTGALAAGRGPALRLRGNSVAMSVTDYWAGVVSGVVDDFVVRRQDGVYAYNLVVVVDDIAQGVTQVVRGDDLLSSSPRQAYLTTLLGGVVPQYAHVPLVVNAEGKRLAKRDGDVTLAELGVARAMTLIGHSLGLCDASERIDIDVLLNRFDPEALPRKPWIWRG